MKLKEKKTLILTSIIILLPVLVGILLWKRLPQEMAIHFDSAGEANGWSSKWFAVFGLPLFLFIVNILCTVGCAHDPRRAGYPEKMMKIIYWICPVASWICAVGIYGYALGFSQEGFAKYVPVFVGLLLVIIGNYLPKVKQNYYLGIKLPWTYTDEENWNKTHRLGGRVWVVGGVLMMLNFFMRIRGLEIAILLALILIPTIYSWAYSIQKSKS